MNSDKGTVWIVGAFRFPAGDAAAARVLGIGKSLRRAGFEISFAGWEHEGRACDRTESGGFVFEGFSYFPQSEFRVGQLSPVKRLLRYLLAGSNTLRMLKGLRRGSVRAVIVYHGGSLFLLRLALFCRFRGIRLIADCTEWYDAEGLVGGRFGVAHLDSEFRMRIMNRLIGRMIVISEYLSHYYERLGCSVLRVPPTVDLAEEKWSFLSSDGDSRGLKLVYAGVPGKKDLLASALRGIRTLRREGVAITIDLIGPSPIDLLSCVDGDQALIDELAGALVFHGRVAQELVPSLVAKADFSILLRPVKRVSAAGFSTKLVESLAAGVPVIANRTGDIDRYVKDGYQGILLGGVAEDDFVAGARRALALSRAEIANMRMAARACAEKNFVYESYSSALARFVGS